MHPAQALGAVFDDRARRAPAPSVPLMSMTNEDHNAEWELGDAITIRLDPEEPEDDDAADTPDDDDA